MPSFDDGIASQSRLARALDAGLYVLHLSSGERVKARSIIIASGARYRRLALESIASFEGASVHYWVSPFEAKLCAGQELALVGAGNSAGQAAVYLSAQVAKVWLLVRGPGLSKSMSRYLADRIAGLPNVEVSMHATVGGLEDATASSRRFAGVAPARRKKSGATSGTCSSSSAPIRIPSGFPDRA